MRKILIVIMVFALALVGSGVVFGKESYERGRVFENGIGTHGILMLTHKNK